MQSLENRHIGIKQTASAVNESMLNNQLRLQQGMATFYFHFNGSTWRAYGRHTVQFEFRILYNSSKMYWITPTPKKKKSLIDQQ